MNHSLWIMGVQAAYSCCGIFTFGDFRTKMVSTTKIHIHMKPSTLNHADTPSPIVLLMIKESGFNVPSVDLYFICDLIKYHWLVRWTLTRFYHVSRRWRKMSDSYFETCWTSFRCYRCFKSILPILQIRSLLRTKLFSTKSWPWCSRRWFWKRKWWQGTSPNPTPLDQNLDKN